MVKAYKTQGCTHDAAKAVFKVGKGTQVWAGAQSELLDRGGWALVISAVGFTDFTANPITSTKASQALLPVSLFEWAPPACVGINWPDRGVPGLSAGWWATLAKALPGIKGDIGLCCMGGHGRTGVMLAILASLLGKVRKGECPVAWVRKRYCTQAVESDAQLDYVERVTGRRVFSDASDAMRLAPMAQVWAGAAAPPLGTTWAGSGSAKGGAPEAPANPTVPDPGTDTAGGYEDGTVVGDNPGDEEMLDAWFRAKGDVVTTIDSAGVHKYVVPVWNEEGDHVGWQTATAADDG